MGWLNDVSSWVKDSADKYGVDENLVNAVIQIESAGNPDAYRDEGKGRYSLGLMQLMRGGGAVDEYEKKFGKKSDDWFKDPKNNIHVGTWYLGEKINGYLEKYGHDKTVENMIIAYNAGIGTLNKIKSGQRDIPQVTKDYLEKLSNYGIDVNSTQVKKKSSLSPVLLAVGAYKLWGLLS